MVEQHQPRAGLHAQIAGMRVGVQDAQVQHLLGVEIVEQTRHLVGGDARLLQGFAVGNLDALDVLHHEQALGAQFGNARWNERI